MIGERRRGEEWEMDGCAMYGISFGASLSPSSRSDVDLFEFPSDVFNDWLIVGSIRILTKDIIPTILEY